MALAKTRSVALVGIDGFVVDVEAAITSGVPGLHLVGLPDAALSEARDRVRAAILNSGEQWPQRHITVSLCPASLPKRGSSFDLSIAISVLGAAEAVSPAVCARLVMIGELGLDGRVHAVPGVLPAILGAAEAGFTSVVVPKANGAEASLVPGVKVIPVGTLRALMAYLRDEPPPVEEDEDDAPMPASPDGYAARSRPRHGAIDLSDVRGQGDARRALEISAAGGHHLWLSGPPGCGKTMLAERLPTLLPPLERSAALEVTTIHSVAGTLPSGQPLITEPPFYAPHHTATRAAMIGGGSHRALRPGAASLAHQGVLFLDEAPEFATGVLDALRQPLEDGAVTIARAEATARFPARFTLVLAANPCPCAAAKALDCLCTPAVRSRYLGRISGPLLDRVDLKLELEAATRAELRYDLELAEPSEVVAERVLLARERAAKRLAGTPWRANSDVPGPELRRSLALPAESMWPVDKALTEGTLSARGMHRVLRVAWTIADLGGRDAPADHDVSEALELWKGKRS
ncbi:YifB family Mg chelatase-like AAA ATPase [Actinomadura sp. HBU206391]|uniref:YifB family Mg chelatase-like AAA ATPase n=1 Tax=Actinomadura sp. HBU206391 TaxID=2731692 RepID=UPI0016508746|nr:YifB family Mg chelatase-like AAA ATPase [Actinomadura sp. HBU206391]MBC6460864.1 YifB family Mg chelatase-like AAA ATPase [Actinomadura sp. HBU206391]